MKKKVAALVLSSVLMLTASVGVYADESDKDIVDTAVSAGDFSTLVAAVTEAGLVDALKGEGPFTVFAPTDAAFAALLEEMDVTAEELLANEALEDILLYHVAAGKVLSSDLTDGQTIETLNGATVEISLDPVQVNEANVVTADIEATNGVIHVIDSVLMPPVAEEEPSPEENTDAEAGAEPGDIVDIAAASDDFTTLVAAVQKAGLVDALKGEGPYTVFAPTNAAFAKLLSGLGVTAEELLARDDLKDILLYHVAQGKVLSTDLVDGMEVTMLNGDKAIVSLNSPMINDSAIVTADVEASNGVIHVIDAVLLPPADAEAPPIPKTGTEGVNTPLLIAIGALAAGAYIFMAKRKQNA